MLVIAQHKISEPEKFWSTAKKLGSLLPGYLRLHSVMPSRDQRYGTCIWEAASVHDVQQFLDEHLGDCSDNFCYEINQDAAIGLPTRAMEAFNN